MGKKDEFKEYCKSHVSGFKNFTKLQNLAFDQEEFWNESGKDIFVQGHTSSGKTLIGFSQIWNLFYHNKDFKVLYLIPFKALAYQKYEELQMFFPCLSDEIVLSTSEFKERDRDVLSGTARIVVTIYEKVFLFQNLDDYFFQKWSLVILDEFGIVDNMERGVKADFIFRRVQKQMCRMIVMVTPFYDWSSYIEYGDFLELFCLERPVEIEEYLLCQRPNQVVCWTFEKINIENGVKEITINNYEEITEGKFPISLTVQNMGYIGMLCQICYEHYLQDHSIIVFLNNREGVRQRVKDLYLYFSRKGIFTEPDQVEIERFFQEFLGNIETEPGDLYGVFEEDDDEGIILKRALYHGITFHSAAQSYRIRRAIENGFYGNNSFIRIVVATETLAFGVNSNADVVIVSDIQKPNNSKCEVLTKNEYKNYIGRAGRFGHRDRGYAYTLVRMKDLSAWKNLLNQEGCILQSNIYQLDWDALSMYILSMFVGDQALSEDDILSYIMEFPACHNGSGKEEIFKRVQIAIQALVKQEFIKCELFSKRYAIRDLGKAVRGYVFEISKFEKLWLAINVEKLYVFDFVYNVVGCLSETDIYAYVPNKKKYAKNIEAFCVVIESYFERWIQSKIISEQMAKLIENMFQVVYLEGKGRWCLNSTNKDAPELFPFVRIATMLTMYLEGYGTREIYEILRTTVGTNTKIMSKVAYYIEISSILAAYKNEGEKSHILKSISSALYYGGLPYRIVMISGDEILSAHDRETLIFINHYLNLKEKEKKNLWDNLKLENMEERIRNLPEKYHNILKCLEEKDD